MCSKFIYSIRGVLSLGTSVEGLPRQSKSHRLPDQTEPAQATHRRSSRIYQLVPRQFSTKGLSAFRNDYTSGTLHTSSLLSPATTPATPTFPFKAKVMHFIHGTSQDESTTSPHAVRARQRDAQSLLLILRELPFTRRNSLRVPTTTDWISIWQ